jgi:hypothetical protein
MFAAHRNVHHNSLPCTACGGSGTGGFSLTCRKTNPNRSVPDAQLGGDLPEAGTLGFHGKDAVSVYNPAWTTKLFTVGTGIDEPTLHSFLGQ